MHTIAWSCFQKASSGQRQTQPLGLRVDSSALDAVQRSAHAPLRHATPRTDSMGPTPTTSIWYRDSSCVRQRPVVPRKCCFPVQATRQGRDAAPRPVLVVDKNAAPYSETCSAELPRRGSRVPSICTRRAPLAASSDRAGSRVIGRRPDDAVVVVFFRRGRGRQADGLARGDFSVPSPAMFWLGPRTSMMVHVRYMMGKLIGRQAGTCCSGPSSDRPQTRPEERQPRRQAAHDVGRVGSSIRGTCSFSNQSHVIRSHLLDPRTRTTARARRLPPRPR